MEIYVSDFSIFYLDYASPADIVTILAYWVIAVETSANDEQRILSEVINQKQCELMNDGCLKHIYICRKLTLHHRLKC